MSCSESGRQIRPTNADGEELQHGPSAGTEIALRRCHNADAVASAPDEEHTDDVLSSASTIESGKGLGNFRRFCVSCGEPTIGGGKCEECLESLCAHCEDELPVCVTCGRSLCHGCQRVCCFAQSFIGCRETVCIRCFCPQPRLQEIGRLGAQELLRTNVEDTEQQQQHGHGGCNVCFSRFVRWQLTSSDCFSGVSPI